MAETTVWACKKCGRSWPKASERCQACSGSMGCIAESDAIRRVRTGPVCAGSSAGTSWEPPTGWYSDEVMRQDWRDNRVSVEAR